MNSNMYEVNARSVSEIYSPFLAGASTYPTNFAQCMLLIVHTEPLSAEAHDALVKSAEALSYSLANCVFLNLRSEELDLELGSSELKTIIEGLDPFSMIACDATTCDHLQDAYLCPIPAANNGGARKPKNFAGTAEHLLGRTTICYADFNALMESSASKQAAWALLKRLPRLT